MTDWDERFIGLARHIAGWSKNPSTKVGAVVVDRTGCIVSEGYNDVVRRIELTEAQWNDSATRRFYGVHAEANVILHARIANLNDCVLYVTHFPCVACAKLIIESGICIICVPESAGIETWEDEQAKAQEMFLEAGILAVVVKEN